MSEIGIDLDQLNYGNILVYFEEGILGNGSGNGSGMEEDKIKLKIFYDQREKVYDKISEGIKTFTSIEKLNASIQRDQNYFMEMAQVQDSIALELIYQAGLILIDMMYQVEIQVQNNLSNHQNRDDSIVRDQPIRRNPIPSILLNCQKSYYLFDDDQIRLNEQYLNGKINYLQTKNIQIIKELATLAQYMIASQHQRVSLYVLLGEIDRIIKIQSDVVNRKTVIKSAHSMNSNNSQKKEEQYVEESEKNSNSNISKKLQNSVQRSKNDYIAESQQINNSQTKKQEHSISKHVNKNTISKQYVEQHFQSNNIQKGIQISHNSNSNSKAQSNSISNSHSNNSLSLNNNNPVFRESSNSNSHSSTSNNLLNEKKNNIMLNLQNTKQTKTTEIVTVEQNTYYSNNNNGYLVKQHYSSSNSYQTNGQNQPFTSSNSQNTFSAEKQRKSTTQLIISGQVPFKQIIPKQHILINISKAHQSAKNSLQTLIRQIQLFPNLKKKQYYDNSTYYGELSPETNKRSGLGVYIYPSGDVYFGTWKQNQLINGTYIFKNGQSYEGSVKNGKQGWGKYRYSNGNVYEGEWKDDIKQGKGTMYYPNQDKYQGEWRKGKKNGWGKYWYNNGTIYEGNFVNGRKNGYGTIYFTNGTRIEANWHQTHVQGEGKVYYPNGDFYQGEYHMSQKHGKGLYIWSASQGSEIGATRYEGEFKKDNLEGQARIHFTEKEYYFGRIKNGKRDGQGTYVYQNGDSFHGEWKNDFKLIGNYKFKNGDEFEGKFKQNQLNFGVLKYANGQIYQGQFKNGYRHGVGSYKNRSGQLVCEGHWQNDDFISK